MAYDGFDYTPNQALNGLSGSTGWSSPWDVQNGNSNVPGYQTVSGSLSYTSLQNTGNASSGGFAFLTSGRRLNTSSSGPFSAFVLSGNEGIGTNNSGTLWISYLLRKNNNNNEHVFIDLHNNNIPWCSGCANQHIATGYFGAPSDVSGQRRWTLRLNESYYPSSVTIVPGQDYFIVLRIQFSAGGTQVDMYINPDLPGDNGPSAPTITQSTGTANIIRSMVVYLGSSPGNGMIDEIRFANFYECVAPDQTVQVNLPPVAQFSMTPSTGQIPLSVTLDASASYDPEGQPLSFQWNFGDGTGGATGVTVNHTYNVLGQIPVALTVTDSEGLTHTLYQTLTLLNEQNSLPCQTTITCYQMPGCNASNGHIRINTSGTIFSLSDANENTIPVQPNNEYQNLSPGSYTLYVQGILNECRDTFEIYMRRDSTTCQSWTPPSCAMEIGTNLSGFADWSVERPMKNLFKHIRREVVTFTNACNCWNLDAMNEITTDAEGYPVQIPFTTSHGPTMVRFILSADGGNLRADSTYVLLWSGTGSFTWGGGITILQNQPNRVVFRPTNNGNIFINITQSTLGDHLRNFKLVRPQHENDDLINAPFYPVFLEKIAPFSVLRFMDWGETNNSPNVQWQNRGQVNSFTYAGHQGVPYEIMIQLANITGKDVWICVPHEADDDYVTQMATLFRDQLNPKSRIYLEYSNEVWNWIFSQAHYNDNNRPANLSYGRAMAEKAKRIFRIWHTVFGEDRCRVKRVLGIQAGFNGLNEQILSQLRQDDWDYGSPTHYFGLDHTSSGNPVLHEGSTINDVMSNALNSWSAFKPTVKRDYNNIHVFGKEIITYEGGQHFVGNVFGIPYDYQQAMWDAQNSQAMYDMYDRMHDTIHSWGCRLAVNFSLASPQESIYGSWGVLSDIDVQPPYSSTARKYQSLLDNAPEVECLNLNIWNGNKNQFWSDRCNWDKSRIPDTDTDVIIIAERPHIPHLDVNAEVRSVRLAAEAALWILTGNQLTILQD